VTDTQLYLSIGIPILSNAALMGLLILYVTSRFDTTNQEVKGLHEDIRELRSGMKLLTGKVYEMMGQK
jgi:hypothetical protein